MEYTEYRGVRGLCFAEVTETDGTYSTSNWKRMSGVQGIVDTPNESTETHFYDDMGVIVIDSEGADDVALTISKPNNETKAAIDGVTYDKDKDLIIGTKKVRKYYAIAYIGSKTDGTEEAVIHYKGKFSGGAVTRNTKTDGTEATNLAYNYTGVYTAAGIYTPAGEGQTAQPAKKIVVPLTATVTAEDIFGTFTGDESSAKALTPDEIKALA